MPERDRRDEATSDHPQPIDPPVPDEERRQLNAPRPDQPGSRDAGKTSGGGSLGHVQPDKVQREAPLRNNPEGRESDEPTMPSKESSLNTKI
jgi:hypothetical protein